MNHFHTLKVKDIRKETNQAVSIAFELPADLKNTFSFESGQYVTVKKNVDGEDIRRSYSICSTPFEEEIRIGVKKIDNGKMSGFLNDQLTVGDELEIMPPAGNFTAKNHAGNIIGVAAGSGITPVFSLLKSVIKAGGKFTLFYGNINEASTIFKKELDALATNHPNNFVVHYTYDEGAVSQLEAIQCGRIDEQKMNDFIKLNLEILKADGFYICGPEAMINTVNETFKKMGVADEKIHFELFTTPVKKAESLEQAAPDSSYEGTSHVTVIMDGEEFEFDLNSKGATILDTAIEQGADAPFSCKGAVCCTCKAQIVEGKATMEMNYALSDEEVADGFILTCQAHPASDKLVVDYDVI